MIPSGLRRKAASAWRKVARLPGWWYLFKIQFLVVYEIVKPLIAETFKEMGGHHPFLAFHRGHMRYHNQILLRCPMADGFGTDRATAPSL